MLKVLPEDRTPSESVLPAADDVYLTARQVRARFGDLSDMSLWRWINDPEMDFPRPLVVNTRRFWRLSDLVRWERGRAGRAS